MLQQQFCMLQVYTVCCNSNFVCCRFEYVCCSTHFVCSKSNFCAACLTTLNLCAATLSLCMNNKCVNDIRFCVQQSDVVCAKLSKCCMSPMGHRTILTQSRFSSLIHSLFLHHTPWTSPCVTPVITHLVIPLLLSSTQSPPRESIQQTTNNHLICRSCLFWVILRLCIYLCCLYCKVQSE